MRWRLPRSYGRCSLRLDAIPQPELGKFSAYLSAGGCSQARRGGGRAGICGGDSAGARGTRRYCASMGDDWRVCIAFGVLPRSRHSFRQALIPALGSRLGDQVAVGSSATRIFWYAPSIGLADEAAQVARELLAQHDISWSPRPPAAPATRSTTLSAERRHMCPECARPDPRVILRRRSELYEGGEPACRPGSVRPLARGGGHPSGTAVAGSLVRSTREHRAGRPRSLAQGAAGSPLDLAPGGVYRAAAVTCGAGGLLHHRFTLTPAPRRRGGLFSVALSRGLPRVGVTDHPALWSPDLPHRACARRDRPADSPVLRIR